MAKVVILVDHKHIKHGHEIDGYYYEVNKRVVETHTDRGNTKHGTTYHKGKKIHVIYCQGDDTWIKI